MVKIKFMKGKRNRYKSLVGFYACKILFEDGKYRKGMRTLNFRFKRNVYTIFLKI